MKKSQLEMVRDFHVATGSPVLPSPGVPPHDRVRLRCKLIMEEAVEAVSAMLGIPENRVKDTVQEMNQIVDDFCDEQDPMADLPSVGKELNDLLYVTHGAIHEFGLPEHMFDAVHENNMTKVNGPRRADGKREKPPGYVKLDAARWLAENGLAN